MKKKRRMNPVLKKELVVNSRSIKMSLAIMGVNAFLALIALVAILEAGAGSSNYEYSALVSLFPIIGCLECGMLSLIVPIITSGSISGEREKQTLDIMLTTPMSPFSIAAGKLWSAMVIVMMYMLTSIPILSIAFVLGGMSWWALLGLLGMLLYLGIYVGSIGIFCSSVVKRSISATVLTIIIGVAILMLTSILFAVGMGVLSYLTVVVNNQQAAGNPQVFHPGLVPAIMMFNPYSPFFDFMLRSMTNYSICEMVKDAGSISPLLEIFYNLWIPISIGLNLFIALGFLKLAGKNITVSRKVKRKHSA